MVCLGFEPGAGAMAAHTRIAAHLGSGSVGKAVASYNRGLGFESSDRHNFTEHWLTVTVLKIQKRCRNDSWKLFGTHIFNNEIICCIHFAAYWFGWPVRKLLQPLCSMRLLVLKCRFGVKDMSLLFIWAQLRLQHLKMWRSGYRILMKCSLIRYKCWSYCLQLYLL